MMSEPANPQSLSHPKIFEFTNISSNFAETFDRLFSADRLDHEFLVHYATTGKITRFTRNEFLDSVEKAAAELWQQLKPSSLEELSETVFVTLAGNHVSVCVALIAALRLGMTVCPLNPNESEAQHIVKLNAIGQRLAVVRFVGDQATAAVSDQSYFSQISGRLTSPHQFLDGSRFLFADSSPEAESVPNPRPAAQAERSVFSKSLSFGPRAMVLIFTSGSTGYSKIVEQSEIGIMANVDCLITHHRLGKSSAIGTPLPIYHVNALEFSFLGTFFSEGRLVLFESFQLHQTLRAIVQEKIQILSVVPHIIKVLRDRSQEVLEADLSSLRYLNSAAAPLSTQLARDVLDIFPFGLIQGYGLSEAVNFSLKLPIDLSRELSRELLTAYARPSIGSPLACNEVLILDEDLSAVPMGESGEICVRGPNVMLGYRHDTSGEVFRGGVLHTGDVGFCIEREGQLFYFISGRKKDTAKRFGETVSLVEIDDQLMQYNHPDVFLIAAAFENESAGEELAAVVYFEKHAELGAEEMDRRSREIAKWIEANVPLSLRPRALILSIDPVRTTSGKPLRWKFAERLKSLEIKIFSSKTVFIRKI